MFETARFYTESFTVYGQCRSFEWQQLEEEDPILFTMEPRQGQGSLVTAEHIVAPDRADLLPPAIARFTQSGVYDASTPHRSFLQGGRPWRITPAPRPRVRPQHRRAAAVGDRRRDGGAVDGGGYLRACVRP